MPDLGPEDIAVAREIGDRLRAHMDATQHAAIDELVRRVDWRPRLHPSEGEPRGAFFELRALNTVVGEHLGAAVLDSRAEGMPPAKDIDVRVPGLFAAELQSARVQVVRAAYLASHFTSEEMQQALHDGVNLGDTVQSKAESILAAVNGKCQSKRFDLVRERVWLITEAAVEAHDWLVNHTRSSDREHIEWLHHAFLKLSEASQFGDGISNAFQQCPNVRVAVAACRDDRIDRLVCLPRSPQEAAEARQLQQVFGIEPEVPTTA